MQPTTSNSQVAAAIDATLTGPVLVVGSPPPAGRDLDLLAPKADYDAIIGWLADAGFLRWRQSWVRFDGTGTYCVDASSTGHWRPKGNASSLLFEDAETIPGYAHLVTPSPATVLLLAARGMVTRRGRVTDEVRDRVTGALEREPRAWSVAEQRAGALGMIGALRLLRKAYEAHQMLSPSARAAGLAAVWLHEGPAAAKARVFVDARPRRWRPAVVSISGLDGSGKSTQVSQLRETLARLGVLADVQWAGFKTGSSVRAALPLLDRSAAPRGRGPLPATSQGGRDPIVPTACLGHPLGQHVWMTLVVALNAISLWRYVLIPRHGTDVVIFDRFSPDSAVKIDFHFRGNRNFDTRWERALFRVLSPKADIAFLVAVPSDVAFARRQEQTPDELAAMSQLYDEQVARFGLLRLDGTEPADALSRRVILEAWQGMR